MDAGRGVGSNTCSSDLWEQMGRINEVLTWKVNNNIIIFFKVGRRLKLRHAPIFSLHCGVTVCYLCSGTDFSRDLDILMNWGLLGERKTERNINIYV